MTIGLVDTQIATISTGLLAEFSMIVMSSRTMAGRRVWIETVFADANIFSVLLKSSDITRSIPPICKPGQGPSPFPPELLLLRSRECRLILAELEVWIGTRTVGTSIAMLRMLMTGMLVAQISTSSSTS